MQSFKEFIINEAKLRDLTDATKAVSLKKYKNSVFVIKKHTQDDLDNMSKHELKHAGDFSWDIVDNIKPDLKTSFPIDLMQNYDDRTTAINVKYAIRDIMADKWEPEA